MNRDDANFGVAPMYKLKEAAKYLNVCPMTMYRLIKRGDIPCRRLGGHYRIHKVRLDEWITKESEV